MLTLIGRTRASVRDDDDAETRQAVASDALVLATPTQQQGAPLLSRPVASAVSGITGIASFNIRAATKIGGWTIYASREATLKSLAVARTAAEQVLILAGRDVASRAEPNSLGQVEAANALESAIRLLHSAISTASFVASSGFYLTEATLNSVSGLSIHGLTMLNAVVGNTETSKALAAVVTLLLTELNEPQAGYRATYKDLVLGLISFVLLQRWARRKTQLDFQSAGGEETIWDSVIDDRGFRADVVGTRRQTAVTFRPNVPEHTHSFVNTPGDEELEDTFEALERGTLFDASRTFEMSADDQARLSDEEIRDQIVKQLPSGARAVVSTDTFTAKTIKVEIFDADATNIEAPPGTIMVAERLNHDTVDNDEVPRQTIVFRTALQRSSSAKVDADGDLRITGTADDHSDQEEGIMMRAATTPLPSSKDDSPELSSSWEGDQERLDRIRPSNGPSQSEPMANQKKSRKPVFALPAPQDAREASKLHSTKGAKGNTTDPKREKEGKIKKAMKSLSPTSSFAAMKDVPTFLPRRKSSDQPMPTISRMTTLSPERTQPRLYPPVTFAGNSTSPLGSPSRAGTSAQNAANSYFVRETRRDSIVSQTDMYSVHSGGSRPGSRAASPTFSRTQSRTKRSISQTQSELGLSLKATETKTGTSGGIHHQRTRSFQPSLYSMGSKHSGEAVVLAPRQARKSIYEDSDMVDTLMRDGKVPGMFPDEHLVKTVRRFSRFATASYGWNFLEVMGLNEMRKDMSKATELVNLENVHREHSSFSNHTGMPANTILLSSFYDPHGVMGNTGWSSPALSPLGHFICLDDKSKAIVLSCRGTLGYEDVLTDMTCDYDDLVWQGQTYKVHKGIHASARRLLGGVGSRVMTTLKAALIENPDYGLVMCGHSLGGAVAALVAILIAEPSADSSAQSFVTGAPPKLLTAGTSAHDHVNQPPVSLPPGRPIHVFSYGTPAIVSEPLRLATRGLITTIANAADIVPCLSLGTLHDFRTIAHHLRDDTNDAFVKLRTRVWQRIYNAFSVSMTAEKTPGGPPPPDYTAGEGVGEDLWAWNMLQELRTTMTNDKLVPAGEVFIIESTRVFDRLGPDVKQEARFGFGAEDAGKDNTTERVYRALGRPATRVQFKLVRDVPKRFAEIRFGSGMFADHSPGRYERNLGSLEAGVCDE